MRFGPLPLDQAVGGIVAHTVRGGGVTIKKGARLTAADAETLHRVGMAEVIVARFDDRDIAEDQAARVMAEAACGPGLRVDAAFTGRCNLRAGAAGLLRVRVDAINAANAVDEALTIATPPDYARLAAGQLAATAKVIPYAADGGAVEQVDVLLRGSMHLHPFLPLQTTLIVTRTEGQKESVIAKGAQAVQTRLTALGSPALTTVIVAHDAAAVRSALDGADAGDLTLILGGSATSDRRDIAPAAVTAAGGSIERFGMPVDPGNLLALGMYREKPLVILPGCARSLALNGADWILERLAARLPVTGADIAAMGVGGLLKEIPSRPQPRER